MMSKRMKWIFCVVLLVVLGIGGSVCAAADYTLKSIRFFDGGYNPPPDDARFFSNVFLQSDARYIWCQVDITNPLYQVRSHTHKVVFKYFRPDGSLMGETKADFTVRPEWDTAWLPGGWGWNNPGNWPTGTYTVQVYFDDQMVGSGKFRIAPPAASGTLMYRDVKFFESGYNATPQEQRVYREQFPASNTRYVFYELAVTNRLYQVRNQVSDIVAVYYDVQGNEFGRVALNYEVPAAWAEADLWHGWGWDQPGNWKAGRYTVDLYVSGELAARKSFEIY